MEGGTVDTLLVASDDILRSIELCLGKFSNCTVMTRARIIPDGTQIGAAREQRLARHSISRL